MERNQPVEKGDIIVPYNVYTKGPEWDISYYVRSVDDDGSFTVQKISFGSKDGETFKWKGEYFKLTMYIGDKLTLGKL